ncbi:hypothetical protein GCM10027161_14050 [Microbispora hainanensis]
MPRPSLVTSSGPSPVRGFIAAMRVSLPALSAAPEGNRRIHVSVMFYYPASELKKVTARIRSVDQCRETRVVDGPDVTPHWVG